MKTGKGARFIILHAGGSQGFIHGALLMFKSKLGNKGDYHDSMNHLTFRNWFENQLLPNIPSRSLIVMDNAPYHCIRINKAPTSISKKADIIQWLTENSIPHDPTHTRPELLLLVKHHKTNVQRYEIDELAAQSGHKVLRLPPYYCQFNPIELIWAQIKTEVKKENSNKKQTLQRVEQLTREAVEHVTAEDWQKCIGHTRKLEEEYRRKDLAYEHLYEQFVINLSPMDSSSSDECSDEDDIN